MLPGHEVPTHLDVEDRVFFGFMTVRHVLVMAAGGFFAMALALSPPLPLPEALRYLVAVVIGAATLAIAFVEPDGRKMEDWLLAVIRFYATPRVLVWIPRDSDWSEEGEEQQGVLVLTGKGTPARAASSTGETAGLAVATRQVPVTRAVTTRR